MDPTRPPLPVGGTDLASVPVRDRNTLDKRSRFFWDHFTAGMHRRRSHAVAWLMVQSFLKGIHYFEIDGTGFYRPIPPKPGQIRSTTPTIRSRYRHTLGFLNANEPSVTATPLIGAGADSVYSAERGRACITHWINETKVRSTQDRLHQILLTEGTAGLFRYRDPFRQQVFIRALPGSELFPIPFDARDPFEMHGLIHAQIVTKQWLELQDELYERMNPGQAFIRMADKAQMKNFQLRTDIPLGGFSGSTTQIEGSLLLTIWMKETEQTPGGEYMVLVGDTPVRSALAPHTEAILQNGQIPIEIIYFDKQPCDWWGTGFCEALIPDQLSSDRRRTDIDRNAHYNKPWLFYDKSLVTVGDIQLEGDGLIGFNHPSVELSRGGRPVWAVPSLPEGRETMTSLQLARDSADEAAGMRSSIIFGQQQGRTESGPATSLLNANAVASFNSVLRRLDEAWDATYPGVLDMLREVWPQQKTLQIVGRHNLGREMNINRSEIPPSSKLILRSRPMLPGGKQAQLAVLFQLRQMPGPDGTTGTEVSSREFRAALHALNALPPGIEAVNYPESRIQTMIELLINDGRTPGISPSDPSNAADPMVLEDHDLAVALLKNAILDPTARSYSSQVRVALFTQMRFHMDRTVNGMERPNSFDDELEKHDSRIMADFLTSAEADLETQEGEFIEQLLGA